MRPNLQRQRGAVAILVALCMLVLLAVVGLAIDAGLAYMVKARLNAAVDSAAVAAARAVPAGNNRTEQIASAKAAAAIFFDANITNNYLLSKPTLTSTEVVFDGGMVTIDVHAEAPMPVSIMQVLGFDMLRPVAYAQTIRRDLDMALVVDTSGSLTNVQAAVRASAKLFLSKFNVTQDRVGLIHFANGALVDTPISTSARGFDRPAMLGKIDKYVFKHGTASVEGIWHARDQLRKIALLDRSAMRVIVFFSDGAPTGLGTSLDFNGGDCQQRGILNADNGSTSGLFIPGDPAGKMVSASCTVSNDERPIWNHVKRLPDWYDGNDPGKQEFRIVTDVPRKVSGELTTKDLAWRNIDRAARNLSEAVAAKAREEGIFVFTLGLGSALKDKTGYDKEKGEDGLKCMANVADGPARCYKPDQPVGMYCHAATEADLTPCFSRLASAILRISK